MLTIPKSAKRTQRIGEAPDARVPMLAELADKAHRIALLERLASTPMYVRVANAAHAVNTYTETASIGIDYEKPRLSFFLYMSSLARWTDPTYVGALETLDAIQGALRTDKADPDRLYRSHAWVWTFETGDAKFPQVEISISMDAYEKAETAECRRVQVGTRTVEEPIWRMECVAPEGTAGELPAPVLALDL